MIILVILFLLIIIFFKFIYFNNLILFIDYQAQILTYIFVFLKLRYKVVEYNLNKVLPDLEKKEISKIYFNSSKLSIMNSLIAMHQRFMIDRDYLSRYYDPFEIPDELKHDLKNNKVIFALGHCGIYTDYNTNYQLISPLSWIYKINNKFFEKFFYIFDGLENKILSIKHDKLSNYIYNEYPSMYVNCDQKANTKKDNIIFLKQNTNFHYSVADIHNVTKRSIWFYFNKYNLKKKRFSIEIIPIIRYHSYKNRKKDIMQKIADLITERAIKYPEQYFWHHDRFNSGLK